MVRGEESRERRSRAPPVEGQLGSRPRWSLVYPSPWRRSRGRIGTLRVRLVVARREDLLELVDHEEDRCSGDTRVAHRAVQRFERMFMAVSATVQPSLPGSTPLRIAGMSPARTTDDFPPPEGPTTPSSGAPASRATRSATRRSRPKKRSASAGSNDTNPLNGVVVASPGATRSPRSSTDALADRLQIDDVVGASSDSTDRRPLRPAAAREAAAPSRRLASAYAHH